MEHINFDELFGTTGSEDGTGISGSDAATDQTGLEAVSAAPFEGGGKKEGAHFEREPKDELDALLVGIEQDLKSLASSWDSVKYRDSAYFISAKEIAERTPETVSDGLIKMVKNQTTKVESLDRFFESEEAGGYIFTETGAKEFLEEIDRTLAWAKTPEEAGSAQQNIVSRLEILLQDFTSAREETKRIRDLVLRAFGDSAAEADPTGFLLQAGSLAAVNKAQDGYDSTSTEGFGIIANRIYQSIVFMHELKVRYLTAHHQDLESQASPDQ